MDATGMTTPHYVEYHAQVRPERPAFVSPHMSVSYRQLHADMLRMLRYVREQGIAAGHIVGVGHDDIYVHWLLLLACECAGAATMSFQSAENLQDASVFAGFDVVIAGTVPPRLPEGVRHCALGAQVWTFLRHLPPEPLFSWLDVPAACADDVVRIGRTSGSTGAPKRFRLQRSAIEAGITARTARNNYVEGALELITVPPAVHTVYLRVHACLRSGVTVAFGPVTGIAERYRITHAWYLPIGLMDALTRLPAQARFPLIQCVHIGGGAVAPVRREEALRRLCVEFHNVYAANETGLICTEVTPQGVGVLDPGVQAWVVDEDGLALPAGQEGELWARTDALISGYWGGASERTDRFFDGAFRTGDRVRIVAPRRLQVLGRVDDVVNLGGIKASPQPVENAFLAHPSVREAAVVMRRIADGGQQLVAVLSLREGSDLREVLRTVVRTLPAWAKDMAALQLAQLPRSAGGKMDRALIRAAADGMLAGIGRQVPN